MDVAKIVTNETCNHNCSFCNARRPFERRELADAVRVRARIDAAIGAGATELVLTGGEPMLRRDLTALVAHAKRAGANTCVLETNGALLSDARALGLAAAGLDSVRVHVPAWGHAADAITRDPGGFARTLAGMEALMRAGLAVEIAAPVVRATLHTLAALPAAIIASGIEVQMLVLGVPVTAPNPRTLASLADAAGAIEATAASARSLGLPVRLDPGNAIPPCTLPNPGRLTHLFSLTRGGANDRSGRRVPVAACQDCMVKEQCPGIPVPLLSQAAALGLSPVADDRTRRRLSLVSTVDEQVARELVTRDLRRMPDGSTRHESIVRINFHCNQACRFCFVSTHLPPATDAAIDAAIAEIAAKGGVLSLSGGEPTLNRRLPELVRMGKRLGVQLVELQTNATRLADRDLALTLVDAGVDIAFVSLHGSHAELSDRITGAPGTFDKTVAGIDAAIRCAMDVRLNFVVCAANATDFPAYIEMVAARWPGVPVTVSFVAASTDVVPLEREMVPRFATVMPPLAQGIRRARELGVPLTGFESMCGIPLCQVPDDLDRYFALAEVPPDGGEFIKPAVCGDCALERRCFGVRRGYAELHGTDELHAIARPSAVVSPS